MEYKYTSRSITDTMELAENIESEKFPGMVICLDGELGSGKTVFVKGFAKSLCKPYTATIHRAENQIVWLCIVCVSNPTQTLH